MVKITLEFEGVDQAIVALGKLVGVQTAKRAAPAAAPDTTPTAASSTVPGAAVTPSTDPKPARKGRSDKGQARGPRQQEAKPAAVGVQGENPGGTPAGSPATAAGAASEPNAGQAAGAPAGTQPGEPASDKSTPTQAPAAAASPAPTNDAELQKAAEAALERVFGKFGAPVAITLMGQFKKADGTPVLRFRELQPADRAAFIAAADKQMLETAPAPK